MPIAYFSHLFWHLEFILLVFLAQPQPAIKKQIFVGDVRILGAFLVKLVEQSDVLEFDGPALEAVAVVSYLAHARDPDAHVQLEDRFLL